MPTHAIGRGKVNLPISFAAEERRIIGELAFREDRSAGSFIRRLVLKAMESEYPKAAEEIAAIRTQRRTAAARGLMLAAGLLVAVAPLFSDQAQRQPSRRNTSVRIVRKGEVEA